MVCVRKNYYVKIPDHYKIPKNISQGALRSNPEVENK